MATKVSGYQAKGPKSPTVPAAHQAVAHEGPGLAAGPDSLATGDVGHQLRNCLNVILGFSELLLEETTGKINPEQRQCLNDILNNAQRLLEITNHFSSHDGGEPDKDGSHGQKDTGRR